MNATKWSYAGTFTFVSSPGVAVWSCPACGALVASDDMVLHDVWHAEVSVAEETPH